MRTIKGKKIRFDDLQVGDIFSLTPEVDFNIIYPAYLNMKVSPSLTLEYADKGKEYAFNVVALEDGRPRTFHSTENVYLFDKKEIFK